LLLHHLGERLLLRETAFASFALLLSLDGFPRGAETYSSASTCSGPLGSTYRVEITHGTPKGLEAPLPLPATGLVSPDLAKRSTCDPTDRSTNRTTHSKPRGGALASHPMPVGVLLILAPG
jgi:hypothetical protein